MGRGADKTLTIIYYVGFMTGGIDIEFDRGTKFGTGPVPKIGNLLNNKKLKLGFNYKDSGNNPRTVKVVSRSQYYRLYNTIKKLYKLDTKMNLNEWSDLICKIV